MKFGRVPAPPSMVAAVGLLVLVISASLWTHYEGLNASAWRQHTVDVRIELARFETAVMDMSRSVSGYAVSGLESWVLSYRRASADADERLWQLRALTADNPVQQQRLDQLAPSLERLMQSLSATVEIGAQDGLEAARQRVAAGPNPSRSALVETLVRALDAEELRLLNLREARADRNASLAMAIILVGSLPVLALLAWSGIALQRSIVQLRQASDTAQVQAEHLHELNEALWQAVSDREAAPAVPSVAQPLDDPARLAALRHTRLLDSSPEESFDRFTRLAARTLQAPICLLSAVDDKRQFFKSAVGLHEPWASARETDLLLSFCQHVVVSGAAVAVDDAALDPMVRDNQAVHVLGVAAYLGVPLATPEGHVLGALCAIDHQPRRWGDQDRLVLERIAQSILAGIAVRMQLGELERRVEARTAEVRMLADAIEHSINAFHIADAELRFTYVNEAYCRMWGYATPLEIVGTSALEHGTDRRQMRHLYAELRSQGSCWLEYTARRKDGSTFEVLMHAHVARNEAGEGVYAVSAIDITERKRAEQAMRTSEERLRLALEAARMGAYEYEPATGKAQRTGGLYSALGLPLQGYDAQYLQRVHPHDRNVLLATRGAVTPHEPAYVVEYRFQAPDGAWVWLDDHGMASFSEDGTLLRQFGTNRDITARREADAALHSALAEKEVLVQEIHHRVKNNLQVISSLLQLQRRQLREPALQEVFCEAENRVRAMALVHERLYQQHHLSRLDFGDYLHGLVEQLVRATGSRATVRPELELQPLLLPVNTAIPLGLIASELITNALKYAYQGRTCGVLRVELKAADAGQLSLLVADDGPGLPANFDPKATTSLGMRLVLMLSRQLGAQVSFGGEGGTRCCIKAPVDRSLPSEVAPGL